MSKEESKPRENAESHFTPTLLPFSIQIVTVENAEEKSYGPIFHWQSTVTGIYFVIIIALGRLSFPAIQQTF